MVRLGLVETWVHVDFQVSQDHLDQQVCRWMANQGYLGLEARQGQEVSRGLMADVVFLVKKDLKGKMAMEIQVQQVPGDPLAFKDLQDLQVFLVWVNQGLMGCLGQQGQKEIKDFQEFKVSQGKLVALDYKVSRGQLVWENLDLPVLQVTQAQ